MLADISSDTSRSTYGPTLNGYVDWHVGRHSADMLTDTSVNCWSICRPICRLRGAKNTHDPKFLYTSGCYASPLQVYPLVFSGCFIQFQEYSWPLKERIILFYTSNEYPWKACMTENLRGGCLASDSLLPRHSITMRLSHTFYIYAPLNVTSQKQSST